MGAKGSSSHVDFERELIVRSWELARKHLERPIKPTFSLDEIHGAAEEVTRLSQLPIYKGE